MNVRSTIYTIKYGLVIGVASYTLQYATKYIIDFKIIRLIRNLNCVCGIYCRNG